MFGLMGSERVKVSSTGALPTEQVVSGGVRQRPDIRAIATRKNQEVETLIWNYHDEDVNVPAAPIDLAISGLPESLRLALVEHFRIDAHHSNAFSAWNEIGSPQSPSPPQYEQLQSAGQLQLLTSPPWESIRPRPGDLQLPLPRQGFSLVSLSW